VAAGAGLNWWQQRKAFSGFCCISFFVTFSLILFGRFSFFL
jgi:hypothetical protein